MAEETKAGTRKVTVGSLSGAVVTVMVWVMQTSFSVPVTAEVSAAAGTIVTALLVYMTRETYSS